MAQVSEAGLIENVSMTIYYDGDSEVDRTIAAIEAAGGKLVSRDEPGSWPYPDVSATFVLPASAVTTTVQLNNMIWIEYCSPSLILETP